MQENIEQIQQYAWKVWRRRWIALGVAVAICAAGWTFVSNMPDKYESMARVFLDTQSVLRPVLDDIVTDGNNTDKIASTLLATLLSRPNLTTVAQEAGFGLDARTPEGQVRLLAVLADEIELAGNSRDNIYVIKYQNTDPELANSVVESLLDIFIEGIKGKTLKNDEDTAEFLGKQIQEYEAKLLVAEGRLETFKRKNLDTMPTEAGGYFVRIQTAKDDLDQAKLLLSEVIQRRDAFESQLSDVSSIVQASTNSAVSMLGEKISALEQRQDALMLKFTDWHPDVIAVKQKIDILKKQQEKELLAPQENRHIGLENPIYQELKIELGKVEAEAWALTARKRALERKVSNLTQLATTIPQVEADLLKLNRDYKINKENYDALVSRREAAKISRDVDDAQFRIIDSPIVPVVPVGPKRLILLSLVLLAGLGGGIALALFFTQVRSTFDSDNELSSATGLPVYGSVSMMWEDSQLSKNRLSNVIFSLVLFALFAAYGVIVAMQVWA